MRFGLRDAALERWLTRFADIEVVDIQGLATGLRKSKRFATVHDHCVHKGNSACSFLSTW